MTQEDDKGVASAALSMMMRERVGSSFDGEATFSADEVEQIAAALDGERACTPPPEAHVATSLLAQWREGAFETTADEAAQTALDEQAVGLDVAPIIEAWLTSLATTEGSDNG